MNINHPEEKCLSVAFINYFPFINVVGTPPNHTAAFGSVIEVFDIVARRINKCYRLVRPTEWNYGTKLPNGTWNGLIGQVVRGEVDLAAGLFTVTLERIEVMDHGPTFVMGDFSIMWNAPRQEPDLAGFVKPFTSGVWSVLFLFVALIAICFHLSSREKEVSKSSLGQPFRDSPQTKEHGIFASSLFYSVALLFSQTVRVTATTNKALLCLGVIMSFVFSNVYKSNLKAMLITPLVVKPFITLEELLHRTPPSFKVWTINGSAIHSIAKNASPSEALGRLYPRFCLGKAKDIEMQPWMTEPVLMPTTWLKAYMGQHYSIHGTCNRYLTDAFMTATTQTLMFRKGSPFTKEFSKVVTRLTEFGILEQMTKPYMQNNTNCLNAKPKDDNQIRPLALGDFCAVFLLWGTGLTETVTAKVFYTVEVFFRIFYDGTQGIMNNNSVFWGVSVSFVVFLLENIVCRVMARQPSMDE